MKTAIPSTEVDMQNENEQLVRDFLGAFDALEWDKWYDMMHPDFIWHNYSVPEPLTRDGRLKYNREFRQSFPEMEHVIEDLLAGSDRVFLRGVYRVRHKTEFIGAPPSGKTLEVPFAEVVYIKEGKIVEEWTISDNLKFMNGLGFETTLK